MKISTHNWDAIPQAITELRRTVFIDEQAVPEAMEWDETDAIATHYLVETPEAGAVATARLYPTGTGAGGIGRMAVAANHRHGGIGSSLLRRMMTDAMPAYDYLELSAQEQALSFYNRFGFYSVSGSHMEAGIPHQLMRCTALTPVLEQTAETPSPTRLGTDTTSWHIQSDGDHMGLLRAMSDQALRRLWIYDVELSHELYDDPFLVDAVSHLARRSRFSEIRFLIHDDTSLVKSRHRLIELMRRLPTHMSLRLVNTDYPHELSPFILADDSGVIFRHQPGSIEGFANFNAGRRVRPLAETFERMWEYGRESVELRSLPL